MTCEYKLTDTYDDKVHQASCRECRADAWKQHVTPNLMLGTVPGGHNDTHGSAQYKHQANFDKGLDAYKQARGEGLAPAATTVAAVEKARKQVKSQERALKKMGLKADEIKTVAGVN